MATLKLTTQARRQRDERDPLRTPVRPATAPRIHSGQGPKKAALTGAGPRREATGPKGAPRSGNKDGFKDARRDDPRAPRGGVRPDGPPPLAIEPTGRVRRVGEPLTDERLSKQMASLGLASRREADAWIEAGWVRVNGRVAVLGERVAPDAHIEIDPAARGHQDSKVTVLMHKPLDVVSGQAEDGHVAAATLVLRHTRWAGDRSGRALDARVSQGLAPAGRLDMDSTGLLVLTQDGRVARQLIGEDSDIEKEYVVHVDWRDPWAWSEQAIDRLRHGMALDGVDLRPAVVDKLASPTDTQGVLRFVLQEGRKRQIRRMCEQVGLRVTQLQRVRIGRVRLDDLPLGQWRFLRDDERF